VDAVQSNPKRNVAQKIAASFIGAKLCHQRICLASIIKKQSVIRDRLQRSLTPTLLTLQRFNFLTTRCGSLPFQFLLLDFFMPERIQKPVEPAPWGPKQGDGGGPRSPDISRPDTKDLLKKMRKVDPNQSKRYRQRTGQ